MAEPLYRIRRVFHFALRGWRIERETDDEIAFHLARRAEQLVAQGWSREAAELEALRRFGPYADGRDQMLNAARRREDRLTMIEQLEALGEDIRYSLRQMRNAPAFAAAIVASFALGIGANATMFGIIDQLLLRPPAHVVAPDQVYRIGELRHFGTDEYWTSGFSYPEYKDYRDHVPALAIVATAANSSVDVGRGEHARQAPGLLVSASYFPLSGARPALGRFFLPEEDREPDGAPAVVIGYRLWQSEFNGESRALGSKLQIGQRWYTIVGVAPNHFTGLEKASVDIFIPITAAEGLRFAGNNWSTSRGSYWLSAYARVRPGVSLAMAEAQATTLRRHIPMGDGATPDTTLRTSLHSILSSTDDLGAARVPKLLVGVSALVLLIACANVASLLVARALRRRREIAVRLALGIGRARLITQLVTESIILAMLGGIGALLVVSWGGGIVRRTLIGSYAESAAVDGHVLAYTAAITVVTGLLAGVVPAVVATATDLTRVLHESAQQGSPRRSQLRSALLLLQTAVAVILLIGTGLFVRSLHNVNAIELGMETNRVLVATMNLRAAGYADAERRSLFESMLQRLKRIPGVADAAVGAALPFRSSYAVFLEIPGIDTIPSVKDGGPYVNAVTPEYFHTVGTRILRGRGFTGADVATHARVMVVSEAMARIVWRGRDPIGQCVKFDSDSLPCTTIVGVAETTHRNGVIEESDVLQYYVQLQHAPEMMGDRILLVRPLDGHPERWVEPVRRALQTAAPNLPFADVRPMQMLYYWQLQPWHLGATMFGIFGALAFVLTMIGLYSVVAYAVAQRTHELGVRIAIGATALRIAGMIVRQALALVVGGLAVGMVIAVVAGRFVEPLLYETSPHDPLTFALVGAALVLISLVASLIPARRAANVDPTVALRAE
jgi:predicted permease